MLSDLGRAVPCVTGPRQLTVGVWNSGTRCSKATEVLGKGLELCRAQLLDMMSGQFRTAAVLVRRFPGRTGKKTGCNNNRSTDGVAKTGAWDAAGGRDRTGAVWGGQGWTPVIR